MIICPFSLYFNSIKVQLEHAYLLKFINQHPYFNSIKVQLERPASLDR